MPTLDHERLRRKIEDGMREHGHYLRAELLKVKKYLGKDKAAGDVRNILEQTIEQEK